MTDIGAAVISAYRAIALGTDRAFIPFIICIFDIDNAVPCEQMAVTGISARHYTVKQIDTAVYCFDNIAGRAYAHQITDLIRRGRGSTALMISYITSAGSPTANPPIA